MRDANAATNTPAWRRETPPALIYREPAISGANFAV